MIRMGGPSDPEEERKLANQAVIGNTVIFGMIVVAVNVAPYLLDQLGFEASL